MRGTHLQAAEPHAIKNKETVPKHNLHSIRQTHHAHTVYNDPMPTHNEAQFHTMPQNATQKLLHNAAQCCTMLHNVVQCCTMWQNAAQCSTMLHKVA